MILHSQIIGEGTPFVILHGFLGMSDNWRSLALKYAEAGFQLHLLDQRNHGRSFHSDDFSYSLMVQDLLQYAEAHQLEAFHLMGHSMGGKTAMLFATEYPEKVLSLIVADMAPKYFPPHHEQILRGLASLDFNKITSRVEADKALAAYVSDIGTRQFLLKNLYWEQENKLNWRFNLKTLSEKYADLVGNIEAKGVFGGETLFLAGEKSNYILPEDEILIREKFPDSQIVKIKNAGHWLQVDNSQDFNNSVKDFLIKG
mgnify:FL=1